MQVHCLARVQEKGGAGQWRCMTLESYSGRRASPPSLPDLSPSLLRRIYAPDAADGTDPEAPLELISTLPLVCKTLDRKLGYSCSIWRKLRCPAATTFNASLERWLRRRDWAVRELSNIIVAEQDLYPMLMNVRLLEALSCEVELRPELLPDSLEVLGWCLALKHLTIKCTGLGEADAPRIFRADRLHNLESLTIIPDDDGVCPAFINPEYIVANCTRLEAVSLQLHPQMMDLTPLANLSALHTLGLHAVTPRWWAWRGKNLADQVAMAGGLEVQMRPICHLDRLLRLTISIEPDTSPRVSLQHLTALTSLSLTAYDLFAVDGFWALHHLSELSLSVDCLVLQDVHSALACHWTSQLTALTVTCRPWGKPSPESQTPEETMLSDPFPDLCTFNALRRLVLRYKPFEFADLPGELPFLDNLEYLDLSQCAFTRISLRYLQYSCALKEVRLHQQYKIQTSLGGVPDHVTVTFV